jgi:hypothetical protein
MGSIALSWKVQRWKNRVVYSAEIEIGRQPAKVEAAPVYTHIRGMESW